MNGATASLILSLVICLLLIKGTLMYTFPGNVGCFNAEEEDSSFPSPFADFTDLTSKHWTEIRAQRTMNKNLQLSRKPKACVSSRAAGKNNNVCLYYRIC